MLFTGKLKYGCKNNVGVGVVMHSTLLAKESIGYEPVHEKTNNLGFRPGLTQTRLYSHRRQLEA